MPTQIMTASGETVAGANSPRPVAVRVDNVSKFYSSRRRWLSRSQTFRHQICTKKRQF